LWQQVLFYAFVTSKISTDVYGPRLYADFEACRPGDTEVAKKTGTSRAWATAIANGDMRGMFTDLLIRVQSTTG
jgi:hypothetical protein